MNKLMRIPDYLEHILSAIKRIERHVTDVDEFVFLQSELLQDAVVRNIEVIGEAANNIQRVDPSFATLHAEVPWQVMYAMRNRLSHGYDKIDFEMVWKTVCNDLPALYELIKAARDTYNN
jgi:uncharacterized protein with HEPN domain